MLGTNRGRARLCEVPHNMCSTKLMGCAIKHMLNCYVTAAVHQLTGRCCRTGDLSTSEQISLGTKSSSSSSCPCDSRAQAQYGPLTPTVIIQLPPAISIYSPNPAALRRFNNTPITKADNSRTFFISSCIFSDCIPPRFNNLTRQSSRQFEAADSEALCSLQACCSALSF